MCVVSEYVYHIVNKEVYKHRVVFWRRMPRTAWIHWTWCHRKKGWSSVCYACDKKTPCICTYRNLSLS